MSEQRRFAPLPLEKSTTLLAGSVNLSGVIGGIHRTGDIAMPPPDVRTYMERYSIPGVDADREKIYDILKPWRVAFQAYFLGDIAQRVDTLQASHPPYGLIQNETDREQGLPKNLDSFLGTVTLGSRRTWDVALEEWERPLERWVRTIPEDDLLNLDPNEFS